MEYFKQKFNVLVRMKWTNQHSRGGSRIPHRRGRQPSGGRSQHTNFPKNCMKLRKFWSVGGGAPGVPPLDPPLYSASSSPSTIINNQSFALKIKKMCSEGTENVSSFYKMKIFRIETISLFFFRVPL